MAFAPSYPANEWLSRDLNLDCSEVKFLVSHHVSCFCFSPNRLDLGVKSPVVIQLYIHLKGECLGKTFGVYGGI